MTRAFASALLVALGSACSATLEETPRMPFSGPGTSIWIVSHGWHVGVALPRAAVPREAWPAVDALGPFQYVEVGWGDGEFYPAARETPGLALKAAFRSTSSVLHVVGFDASVAQYFSTAPIIEIELSRRGLGSLARFIDDHYARDGSGQPVVVAPALYGEVGFFYLATERYSLFHNSNHWTARALRAAGCPIQPTSALTAESVLDQALRFGRALRYASASTASSAESEDCRAPR